MVWFKAKVPQWLNALLAESFYGPCLVHDSAKKNERNIFCLDCCSSICTLCLPPHRRHRLLQIRRYVYHDVLRLRDAEKLMDCSLVQSYITNSTKVVFMRPRPVTRLFRCSPNSCITCNRSLQDPNTFCCLSCKIEHLISTQGSIATHLSEHQMEAFTELDEDNDHIITPDSVFNPPVSLPTSSGSTGSGAAAILLCTASTVEFTRKKRSSVLAPRVPVRSKVPVEAAANRRKGKPTRSPFY
ncbi:hypothetical protein Droror1_Dr00025304 [Drosera rotundifolia]